MFVVGGSCLFVPDDHLDAALVSIVRARLSGAISNRRNAVSTGAYPCGCTARKFEATRTLLVRLNGNSRSLRLGGSSDKAQAPPGW
jgi:hypothetical protein